MRTGRSIRNTTQQANSVKLGLDLIGEVETLDLNDIVIERYAGPRRWAIRTRELRYCRAAPAPCTFCRLCSYR
jgi:hypothetical protein